MASSQVVLNQNLESTQLQPSVWERLKSRRVAVSLVAGICLIVLPAVFFTSLIPYTDLVAMAYLHSYPAKASYGPQHYYVFQFTYILHHIISRAATDFGIPPNRQVLLYYLLQGLLFYLTVSYILLKFVRREFLLCVMLLFLPLAFNDGLFVWGGPPAYSLSAVPLAISVVFILRCELEGTAPRTGWLILLALIGMMSHPFALPFFAILYVVVLVASGRQRRVAAAMLVLLGVYALLIVRDSPESLPVAAYLALFDFHPLGMAERFRNIFTWDAQAISLLFGKCSRLLSGYLWVVHEVQLAGLVLAVVARRRIWNNPALRILLLLYVAFLTFFACAGEHSPVTWWPQRILNLTSFLLLAFSLVALSETLEAKDVPSILLPKRITTVVFALVLVTFSALELALQSELLRNGKLILAGFEKTKHAVLASGLRDERITVSLEGIHHLSPFCMRAVPFMLFPDSDLRARGLIVFTEWHWQPRNNTRIGETASQKQAVLDFRKAPPFEVAPVVRERKLSTSPPD